MERSVLGTAVEALPACLDADGEILSVHFFAACRLVLPVIDKLGTAFMPARADVSGNIERLAARYNQSPGEFQRLFDIIRAEVKAGQHTGKSSCTQGLLWLKRFLEFVAALLKRLSADPKEELTAAAAAAYRETLYPFHGYLSSGVFQVVMRAVPYRSAFVATLLPGDGPSSDASAGVRVVAEDMAAFGREFPPLLAKVHGFLVRAAAGPAPLSEPGPATPS